MKRGATNLRTAPKMIMMMIITIIIITKIMIIIMIPSQVKATLLGALFLIDFMYFEQQQNNNNDWKYTFEKHNYGRHANPQWLWKETKILKITKNYGIHAKYWKSPMIMKGMQTIENHQWLWKACKILKLTNERRAKQSCEGRKPQWNEKINKQNAHLCIGSTANIICFAYWQYYCDKQNGSVFSIFTCWLYPTFHRGSCLLRGLDK